MDLQAWFDARMAEVKAKRFAESDQISLGELRDLLKDVHPCTPIVIEMEGELYNPEVLDSYRGYYSDLAFQFTSFEGEATKMVSQVRDLLDEADGTEFFGYKGGDFLMSTSTPIWVAQYGEVTGIGVIGVEVTDDAVVILTDQVD